MFCNKVSEVLFSTNYQNQENRSKFVETQSLNLPDQTYILISPFYTTTASKSIINYSWQGLCMCE